MSNHNGGGSFFAAVTSGFFSLGGAMHRSVNSLLGYEGLEVINPEGSQEDAEEEARKGRWKQEDREGYWKMMHKYIGADVTSMVSLPVLIFEPMTMLQKMAELMEYAYLLDMADQCDDPCLKLVYALFGGFCQQVGLYQFTLHMKGHGNLSTLFWGKLMSWQTIWVSHSLVNRYSNLFSFCKYLPYGLIVSPSLLQVSHHPPMSCGHAENEHFTYDVTSKLRTKYLGNSVDIYPVGRTRITLKRTGEVLDLVPPPTKVNNLIFGRTWVDSPGEMTMTNLTTGDKVLLFFHPCGWFGAERYEVDGYVYNSEEEPKFLMTGKWNSSMSYQPCDMEGEALPGTDLKEVWRVAEAPSNDKFQYTYFAHKINNLDTAPTKLLASDSRLRPDRYALEMGDLSKAGREKTRMEERQRAEKRQREALKQEFTPKWFGPTGDISSTPWGDLEIYEFNGKYMQHRAELDACSHENAGDQESREFNPWHFSTSSDS